MGVRLYNPNTGRFLSTDPVDGGNANTYTYPTDPINSYDLDGHNKDAPGGGGGTAYYRFMNMSNAQWRKEIAQRNATLKLRTTQRMSKRYNGSSARVRINRGNSKSTYCDLHGKAHFESSVKRRILTPHYYSRGVHRSGPSEILASSNHGLATHIPRLRSSSLGMVRALIEDMSVSTSLEAWSQHDEHEIVIDDGRVVDLKASTSVSSLTLSGDWMKMTLKHDFDPLFISLEWGGLSSFSMSADHLDRAIEDHGFMSLTILDVKEFLNFEEVVPVFVELEVAVPRLMPALR